MSKVIKKMEMDALKDSFKGVRDVVFLTLKGLDSIGESNLRATLRKKKIRLQQVKNTLTRKVFGEMGFTVPHDSPYWSGPTVVAWGGASIAELSRNIEAEILKGKTAPIYKDKVTIKGAIADGAPVPFDLALKMPTRERGHRPDPGHDPRPRLSDRGCLIGPAGQVAARSKARPRAKRPRPRRPRHRKNTNRSRLATKTVAGSVLRPGAVSRKTWHRTGMRSSMGPTGVGVPTRHVPKANKMVMGWKSPSL